MGVFYKESNYDPIRNHDIDSRVSDGRILVSIAAMTKVGRKLSLVFDSFIVPRGGYYDYTEYVYYFDPTTGNDEYRAVARSKRRGHLPALKVVNYNYYDSKGLTPAISNMPTKMPHPEREPPDKF